MPLSRLETNLALQRLRNHPLAFLGNTQVTVGGLHGADTAITDLYCAFDDQRNLLYIGNLDLIQARFTPEEAHQAMVRLRCLATPMRTDNSPVRREGTRRFSGDDVRFWVTTVQTGCSVMIADWGGTFSMVHLQPQTAGRFFRTSRFLMSNFVSANVWIKNFWMKHEMSWIHGMRGPQRYIMVQSMHTRLVGGVQLLVIGVRQGMGWNFYLQDSTLHAQALDWQPWHFYQPYYPATR